MNQPSYKIRKKSAPLRFVISVINLSNIRYSNNQVAQFYTYSSKPLCIKANNMLIICDFMGAQWLSGRVLLDSRPKGSGFEPHRHHWVVSLSKNINPSLVLVQPRKTRPFITERL